MTSAHDFTMKTIDGRDRKLADYAGKALLVVNVASECGYTPQYKGLEALHREMKGRGVAVIGVPCNQFGAQEPGTEKEIAAFCEKNYGVTFDLMAKVDVNGDDAHAFFKWLTAQPAPKAVKWNFEKFVIDKQGNVVARFGSKTAPESTELKQALEKALA